MTSALVKSRSPNLTRLISHRTRGLTRGPVTRLMSPSDFGEILKPFVFLDLFDHEGPPFNGALHPHSGIATLSYVAEGAVSYIDPDNVRGLLPARGLEGSEGARSQGGRAASSSGSLCRRSWNWVRPSASTRPLKMCRETVRLASSLAA